MRPTGPGENRRPMRPAQQWHGTRPYPRADGRRREQDAAWRAPVARDGWRGELPVAQPTWSGTLLRGFTGSLAAGLTVLALGLIGVQFWANGQGEPGPGVPVVVGHLIAAGVTLGLQAI